MTKLRITASIAQAQALAERYAQLDTLLTASQATRQAAIAATNAAADAVDRPLIEEMNELRVQLEGWFRRNGDQLTGGKRRSAELGGCMLGLRAGATRVVYTLGDDKTAALALRTAGSALAKTLLKVTYGVDRTAVKRALDGRRADDVRALGFAIEGGEDAFTLARVDQPGVATPA